MQNVKEQLARACRVLAHHEMLDLWGHASARLPQSDLVAVTPRFSRRCLPRTITAADVLVCNPSAAIVDGRGELPSAFRTDLAVYREIAERQACLFAAPRFAMAAAIGGYPLKPLTHMESATGFGAEVSNGETTLAATIARATAVHEPGIGVWAAGSDAYDCLTSIYHLEYLAQVNSLVATERMRTIAREDSDKLWRQFSGHHHYHEFFDSLDPGPRAHPYGHFLRAEEDPLKAAIAWSCRSLWERGTLVAFLEHVSHRAPDGKHFYMSASKNFRDIGTGDICVLDYQANSVAGPKPPGFKWFHAQLLRERQDALAVVHTHDVHGRAYALSPRRLVPSYRVGLDIGTRPLPTYGRCDLIVDPEVRRATLDALAEGPVVHEIGHGTDFVADNLEKATVDAIQREAFLAMDSLARRFGEPRPLPAPRIEYIRQHERGAEDWWWFYAAEVGAPRRSAAGL
ncbi:MAG TPA: class II aldolase/adducin family protein [Burkholderiales bacterium]|nr:class II aldolase/adducin family protein [Burkholderiales bacterium]